jgi:hypothetical protein
MTLKTKYENIEIKCLNMVHTNNTLVSTNNFKGKYVSFMVRKKRIAEKIVTSNIIKKLTYLRLKKEYDKLN